MKVFILLLTILFSCQDGGPPQEIAKWEEAIRGLETRNQTEPRVECGVLFYGSSSIRRWDTIAKDMAPWPAIQRGYGGAKLPDVIHFSPRMLCPFLGPDNPNRCKAIVLFVGNDIVGKPNDPAPQEVARRFSTLLDWIRSQDVSVPVFWIEVTPTPSRWDAWNNVESATRLIRNVVQRDANAYLISTAGAFLGPDGFPVTNYFVEDQLHLNEAGYQRWSGLIKAQLHAQLGSAPSTAKSGSE